jgi:hypothetical protein
MPPASVKKSRRLMCASEPATLTRPDVIMASHAEGIEAECLLPLARDGDQDRGPFDFVRLPTEPVGIEHNVQARPGINTMPSAALLRHRLLHPLWLFRHFQGSSTKFGAACA